MEEHLTAVALGLAVPTILGVFGFLWRTNARLSKHEKELESLRFLIDSNTRTLESHFNKAFTIRKSVNDL